MKTSNSFLLLILIILIIIPACEKPIHRMETDPVRKKLVLNGSLGPDQTFKVHISSSMEPVGPELTDVVTDAVITITGDNQVVILPQHDSMGFYVADWYPETNKEYNISVKAPTFENASVSITIPQPVRSTSLSKDSMESEYPYIFTINDPGEEINTYMIRAWCQTKTYRHLYYNNGVELIDTLIERNNLSVFSPDELIDYYADGTSVSDESPPAGEKLSTGFIISDEMFNGTSHVFRFNIKHFGNLDSDRPYLFIELISLERAFYDFARSYVLFYKARQTPFAEPVAILSNVNNGLGFIYGYSVHTDSMLIKKKY